MGASKPEDMHKLFVSAFNSGNLESLMTLYEPDARLVPQPGQISTGRDAIRQAILQFLELKGTMQVATRYVLHGQGIALLSGQWHLKGTAPDGKSIEMGGKSVEVARQQVTGDWLLVIDHPFGAD
ncbi:MAG: YybH family protein [Nitrospiraceae bacterium]